MSEHDDDADIGSDELSLWREDPLVKALQAPGSSEELSAEKEYVAAFRAAHAAPAPPASVRSAAFRRLGRGGTAVVVAVALSSGAAAAAAYTQNLPDSVQRVVHNLLGPIGAPPPRTDSADARTGTTLPAAPGTPGGSGGTGQPGTTSSTSTPSAGSTSSPDANPSDQDHASHPTNQATPTGPGTDAPTTGPTIGPTTSPTVAPTTAPSTSPTSSPTTPPAPDPAALSILGSDHVTGVGQSVMFSGVVSASDGTLLPGHRVVLSVRGPRRWLPVGEGVTDATGSVSLTTPPLVQSGRFRMRTDHHVHTAPWRVRMVPTISSATSTAGADVDISVTSVGGHVGDHLLLMHRLDHHLVVVGRSLLDVSGNAAFRVATPTRRTVTYVVRLPATTRHTSVSTRLSIAPLRPASLTISAPTTHVGVDQTVVVSGVVLAADGTPLSGRGVALGVRLPGSTHWRRVGVASTDSYGAVSIVGPPMRRNLVFRLRTGPVASVPMLVRMMPTMTASAAPSGNGVSLTVAVNGGNGGDLVLLRRRIDHQLVTVQEGILAADGTVHFQVQQPARHPVTFVLRLVATNRHTAVTSRVSVPRPG